MGRLATQITTSYSTSAQVSNLLLISSNIWNAMWQNASRRIMAGSTS